MFAGITCGPRVIAVTFASSDAGTKEGIIWPWTTNASDGETECVVPEIVMDEPPTLKILSPIPQVLGPSRAAAILPMLVGLQIGSEAMLGGIFETLWLLMTTAPEGPREYVVPAAIIGAALPLRVRPPIMTPMEATGVATTFPKAIEPVAAASGVLGAIPDTVS